MSKQYSLLSISISDCQEILTLNQYTPEDITDAVFANSKTKPVTKDQFKEQMKAGFEKNVNQEKKYSLDDVLNRIYEVCAQGSNSISVDQLGKGVGVFTIKRLQNNSIKDLFFTLDRELKGVVGEAEIKIFLQDAEKKGVSKNISSELSNFVSEASALHPQNKLELSYWAFYIWRGHPAVQCLVEIFGLVQNVKPSYTSPPVLKKKPSQAVVEIKLEPKPEPKIEEVKVESPVKRPQTQAVDSFDDFVKLRNRLGFHQLHPIETLEAIKTSVGRLTELRLDEFVTFFCNFFRGRYENFYTFSQKLTEIFQFIDANGNGILDMDEFLQAIVHLFGGTEEEKVRAAFIICDVDGSGFLDFKEIQNFIFYTIRLAQSNSGSMSETEEKQLKLIAYATAKDLFGKMDLNGDDKITVEEFLIWHKGSGGAIDSGDKEGAKVMREAKITEGKTKGKIAYSEDEKAEKRQQVTFEIEEGGYLKTIDEIRELIPFDQIPISTAVQLIISTFETRSCDYKKFTLYLTKLVEITKISGRENIPKIAQKLFTTLDGNKNGILDIAELGTGLGLLCGGTQVEKIKAGYDLYDEDNSGFLDFAETTNFMIGFFKIVCMNPPPSLKSVPAEKLGVVLALKCFEELGQQLDGKVGFAEFRDWFKQK
jgi:Ca2+-binding EF-hand superfamily protein